jgi:hypothetical protein
MADVWQYYGEHDRVDRSTLDPLHRSVLAICDLRQEVSSGGFDGYFRYWGGDSAPDALRVLPDALGPSWAALLEEAMGVFGAVYPTDVDDREKALDAVDDGKLDDLATRFFDLEASDDADARLGRYLDHAVG